MADHRRILFLAKVFRDEVHARAFMDGELFARRLSYFKGLDGSAIRRDEDEGAVMLQRDGGVLDLAAKNPETGKIVGSIRIVTVDGTPLDRRGPAADWRWRSCWRSPRR